jgi:ABC-2 type transport system ATP-binding protein
MATPYLDEAERCERVALVSQGRLLALDEPTALQAAYPDRLLEVVASPYRQVPAALDGLPGVVDVQLFGERAHVRLAAGAWADTVDRIRRALEVDADLRVAGVRLIEASLEDVFIDRVRTSPAAARASTDSPMLEQPGQPDSKPGARDG